MQNVDEKYEKEFQERDTKAEIKCTIVSSMEKVFPKIAPKECVKKLAGLRGETVSFQIAYFWNGKTKLLGEISDISVDCRLDGMAGEPFSAKDISVRKVLLVPCVYTNHEEVDDDYLVTEPGLYPDLLRNLDDMGFPVISGQWRSIWVDLSIPKDAAAGFYDIQFVVKNNHKMNSDETFCETVTVNLEVIDQVLPELDIPHTEWLYCDCLANYYHVPVFSDEHWKIIEQFVRTAVRRGCNMLYTPIFTPPLDTAVGGERLTVQLVDVYTTDEEPASERKYSFGFEKLERWIAMGESCGIKYYEMSHLFTQWGAKAAPKIIAEVNGEKKRLFGWDTEGCGKEYSNFLAQFLQALDMKLHAWNIQKRVYFHVSDEPTKDQMNTYKAAKELIKDQVKEYHIIDAISSYEFYENKLIEEPVCSSDHIKDFLEESKRPQKLWVYYCTVQSFNVSNRFISMPGSRTRIIGDMIYRHNIDGFLHWGFNYYNSQFSLYPIDPYLTTDADGAFPSGDPFLVYPGKNGIPEESIRIMLMDEAFSDYRAMKLLEKLTDRETVLKCFEEEIFGELTFDRYARGREYVSKIRDNVNQKIKEAAKKGAE